MKTIKKLRKYEENIGELSRAELFLSEMRGDGIFHRYFREFFFRVGVEGAVMLAKLHGRIDDAVAAAATVEDRWVDPFDVIV